MMAACFPSELFSSSVDELSLDSFFLGLTSITGNVLDSSVFNGLDDILWQLSRNRQPQIVQPDIKFFHSRFQ